MTMTMTMNELERSACSHTLYASVAWHTAIQLPAQRGDSVDVDVRQNQPEERAVQA